MGLFKKKVKEPKYDKIDYPDVKEVKKEQEIVDYKNTLVNIAEQLGTLQQEILDKIK